MQGIKEVNTSEEAEAWQDLYYRNIVQLNGEGNGNPLQYSCLENSMDGGAW